MRSIPATKLVVTANNKIFTLVNDQPTSLHFIYSPDFFTLPSLEINSCFRNKRHSADMVEFVLPNVRDRPSYQVDLTAFRQRDKNIIFKHYRENTLSRIRIQPNPRTRTHPYFFVIDAWLRM